MASQTESAQVKVNLLLSRLPHLHDAVVAPKATCSETFHSNKSYHQLENDSSTAVSEHIPASLPAEIYCYPITNLVYLVDVAAGVWRAYANGVLAGGLDQRDQPALVNVV